MCRKVSCRRCTATIDAAARRAAAAIETSFNRKNGNNEIRSGKAYVRVPVVPFGYYLFAREINSR